MIRQLTLRLLSITFALAVLAVAAQYVALGIADAPLLDERSASTSADWIARAHDDAPEALVGAGLVVLAAWFAYAFTTTLRSTRRALAATTAQAADAVSPPHPGPPLGRTRVDRRRLARTIERDLAPTRAWGPVAIDVRRSGRVDAKVAVLDDDKEGAADRTRAAIDRVIESRALPCRPGRVRVRSAQLQRSRRVQ